MNAGIAMTQARFNIQATNPVVGMIAARYVLVQDKAISTIQIDDDAIEMRYNPIWALTTRDLSKQIELAVNENAQGTDILATVEAAILVGGPQNPSDAKTHTLSVDYKSGNGRRSTVTYPITTAEATDPLARAAAVSRADGMGSISNLRMVNWKITEGAPGSL